MVSPQKTLVFFNMPLKNTKQIEPKPNFNTDNLTAPSVGDECRSVGSLFQGVDYMQEGKFNSRFKLESFFSIVINSYTN